MVAGQIFDTRGAPISVVGSSNTPSVIAGTRLNDAITVAAVGSLVEGGAGADTLTAKSTATNSTLSYEHSTSAVNVNFATSVASGGDAEGDKISGFTNLIGTNFNDALTGTKNGFVYGGGGNDTLTGDGVTTTAVYLGNRSDYTVAKNTDGSLTIADTRSGSPDGTDKLTNIAIFKFSDGTYNANNIIPKELLVNGSFESLNPNWTTNPGTVNGSNYWMDFVEDETHGINNLPGWTTGIDQNGNIGSLDVMLQQLDAPPLVDGNQFVDLHGSNRGLVNDPFKPVNGGSNGYLKQVLASATTVDSNLKFSFTGRPGHEGTTDFAVFINDKIVKTFTQNAGTGEWTINDVTNGVISSSSVNHDPAIGSNGWKDVTLNIPKSFGPISSIGFQSGSWNGTVFDPTQEQSDWGSYLDAVSLLG